MRYEIQMSVKSGNQVFLNCRILTLGLDYPTSGAGSTCPEPRCGLGRTGSAGGAGGGVRW